MPSLTEAIASVDSGALVAATDWCTHPHGLDVERVRGTKNPDRGAIVRLRPDIVIANKEENRKLDVDRLTAAGVSVWVTDIESLDQAFMSMRRMFTRALGWPVPGWLDAAQEAWQAPPRLPASTAAVAIWRDPWMCVGGRTFTGDVLTRLGLRNAWGDCAERYPTVELAELDHADIELVLLPDEPYAFTASDGPEAFRTARTCLVEGRLLTWYGPSLATARSALEEAVQGYLSQQ